MSQPDTHIPDYDYVPFDARDLQMHPHAHGHTQHPYSTRDMTREFWQGREPVQGGVGGIRDLPREGGLSREARESVSVTTTSFYHTPSASMPSASLSSILGAAAANAEHQGGRPGHPPAAAAVNAQQHHVAPRMFAQGLGQPVVDGWAPSSLNGSPSGPPGQGTPHRQQQPVNAVSQSVTPNQVQPVAQKLVLNHHHHRASPPRPPPAFAPTSAPAAFAQSDREEREILYMREEYARPA